jgi:hypothetical protein
LQAGFPVTADANLKEIKMAIQVTQNLREKFSFKNMQTLMECLGTFNMATQAIAVDANAQDIQSTGTGWAMLNGQPEQIEVDAALDVSADTEGTLTNWATATSYSLGDIRAALANGIRLRCIQAHTSLAVANETTPNTGIEPYVSANWDQYWEVAPHTAVNASGLSIADGSSAWFMVTAKADGTLTIWRAGDVAVSASVVCKVPQVDLKLYVPVAFILYANSAGDSNADVIGNASTCDFSTYGTFVQIIGPVFPHEDNWDKN